MKKLSKVSKKKIHDRPKLGLIQLFRLMIQIGNVKMRALVDSGAVLSIISAHTFYKIDPKCLKKLKNDDIKFVGFAGQNMRAVGHYRATIKLENGHTFQHEFYVIPNITEECILGLDFIHNQGFILNGRKRTIMYEQDGEQVSLIARVVVNEPVEIPVAENNEPAIEHLSKYEKSKISELLSKYSNIFAKASHDLGNFTKVQHHIKLDFHQKPIYIPRYRTPFAQRPLMWEHISKLLESGVIRHSTSPYGSPALLVKKKDGETRFVIDYRRLNAITIKDRYPMPRLDETIESFYGAKYFTTLDMMSGYHQIEIAEEDRAKTAFTSEFGHYEFNRMPFGLCNAPATFQRMMNHILRTTNNICTMVYLDDIIIFSKSFQQHLKDIETVFGLLSEANFKLKVKKCFFCCAEVEFLGHIITSKGTKCDPKKLSAIKNYPVPKDAMRVRSFLGLANYYRKFVQNFADKAHPLTKLTGKKAQFQWSEAEQSAFDTLKEALITSPILCFPDFSREFIIHTDASGYGVGAVLGQVHNVNGKECEVVIAYYSKHLKPTQQAWGVTEREAYAIILAIETFRPYLYGRRFTVITDHKPLEWLMSLSKPNHRLLRWSLQVQEYDIAIGYRPGAIHQNADCLSRIPINNVSVTQEWKRLQESDDFCKFAQKAITDSQGTRNLVLENSQGLLIANEAEDENTQTEVDRDEQATNTRSKRKRFTLLPGQLVGTKRGQIIVPKEKIREVLKRYHDHKLAGHLGVTKTLIRIRTRFFWPKMERDIVEYVTSCDICQKRKANTNTRAPLKPIPVVHRVWQRVAMDIIGKVTKSNNGNEYILSIVEYETRYAKAFAMPDSESSTIAKIFRDHILLEHGVPSQLLTDQGRNLTDGVMRELCNLVGVKKIQTTAYHPQTDGLVEKFNGTLGNMLSAYASNQPDNWDEYLKFAVFAYNTSVHTSTKDTPHYLLYGNDPLEPFDLAEPMRNRILEGHCNIFNQQWREARDLARLHLQQAQDSQKWFYDKLASKATQFAEGDLVLLREREKGLGKFHFRWDGPYQIIEKLSDLTFAIRKEGSLTDQVVHANRIRKYKNRKNLENNEVINETIPTEDETNPVPITSPAGNNNEGREASVSDGPTSVQQPPSETPVTGKAKQQTTRKRKGKGAKVRQNSTNNNRYNFREKIRLPKRFCE